MKVRAVPAAFPAIIIALTISFSAAASELPDSVKGFKKETLEVYFNRADLERDSFAWERAANFGAEAAISRWEREASELYSDADQVAQAREQLGSWVGREMEDRYETWLTRRFFERQGALGSEAVLRAINEANLSYLYSTDESGKVKLDDAGDPVLREADGLENDRLAWKDKVASAADTVLAAWDQKVDAAFAPELGALLDQEALARYGDYKAGVKAGLRREMEHAALQSELSLVARRLYDQYSLRKKSEAATADSIADQIVKETRTQTDQGIEEIKASLQLTPETVDTAVPSIEAQRWLESFKAAFEKGLSQWDSAEEKFLVSRMEWERDSGKAYSEGEKAWSTAFEKLSTERKGWEQEVNQLLEMGRAKWDQAQGDLNTAMTNASEEFKKECAERQGSMTDQVGALVDMYAQSVQVVSTAAASGQELIRKLNIRDADGEYITFSQENVSIIATFRVQTWNGYIAGLNAEITNLQNQINAIPPLALLFQIQSYVDEWRRLGREIATRTSLLNSMSSIRPGESVKGNTVALNEALAAYTGFVETSNGDAATAAAIRTDWERLGRLGDWLAMLDTYSASAADAKEKMRQALGSAFGSDAADLRDVLKTDPDSGITYLDEYQLELLRAKAVQDYWIQRKAVADAVVAYAQDISSGRATEDEGGKELASARSAYETKLAAYNSVLNDLKSEGNNLSTARQALDEAQKAVDGASASFEEARQKYLDALVFTESGNVDFYQRQIAQKYSELLSASGMTADTGLSDAATAYYEAARRYGFELAIDTAWENVTELVKGDPNSGLSSLASLKAACDVLNVPASAEAIPSDIAALGVPIDSAEYKQVSSLFNAWKDAAGNARTLAGWKLVQHMKTVAANANAAYQERLAQVKAYGAVDAMEWYTKSGGKQVEGRIEDRLSMDSAAAALALIAARARVEREGLEAWLTLESGGTPANQDALMLARCAQEGLNGEEARSRVGALADLISLLGDCTDVPAATAALKGLMAHGGWIQSFVGGAGSFVDQQAGDLGLALCTDEYKEAERARRLALAWASASSESTALAAEREASALEGIRQAFADHEVVLRDDGVLPRAEDVAVSIMMSGGGGAEFVAELTQELQEAAAAGPRWLEDRVRDYCDALVSYAAAEASIGSLSQDASSRAAAAETAAAADSSELSSFQNIAAGLQGGSRFEPLVEVYKQDGRLPGSAALSHDLIVRAGAVDAAKKVLAGSSLSIQDTAGSLVPGMPELAAEIAVRAGALLEAQNGTGTVASRVTAFRAWSTQSVSQATAGIAINSSAADAQELWDIVKNEADQESLNRALLDYSPPSEQMGQLCLQLQYGFGEKETIFRRFLFGDEFDARLSAFDAGAAGDVYRRATALAIASQANSSGLDRSLVRFLLERTCISNLGDAATDFAGSEPELEKAAFLQSGDLAVEYYCKDLLLRGFAVPDGVPVSEKVAAFRDRLQKVRSYVSGIDGSVQAYSQSVGADFTTQDAIASSIASGQWDDDLFAARSMSGYLDWYEQVVLSEMDAAGQIILGELALECQDLGKERSTHVSEASFWHMVEGQSGQGASWRTYLTETNLGSGVVVASAASARERDTNGYARSGLLAGNAVLDAFNALAQQEEAFAAQLAVSRDDGGSLARFQAFLDNFIAGTAAESDVPVRGSQDLDVQESAYRSRLEEIKGLRDDIRRSGEALAILDLGTEERKAELEALKNRTTDLEKVVEKRQIDATEKLGVFESSGEAYNDTYDALQTASKDLENARFALRVREEIQDWASNGYLTSGDEAVQNYKSPIQTQTEAEGKLVRAQAAVDALKELYGESVQDRPIGDAATLASYDAWKKSYAELLQMNRATGELDEATLLQANRVQELYQALQTARDAVLDGTASSANLAKGGGWAGYLTLQNGNLSLNIASDFKLQQHTEDDRASLQSYFDMQQTLPGDSPETAGKTIFERDMEAWQTTVTRIAGGAGRISALMDKWGLAADFLRRRLYDANGSASLSSLADYSSDNNFMRGYLDADCLKTSGENLNGDARDCLNAAVAEARRTYESVMSNSDERKVFEYYFALHVAALNGSEDKFGRFSSRTSELALRLLTKRIEDKVEQLRANRRAPFGWISDAFANWTGQADAFDNTKGKIETIIRSFSPDTLGSSITSFARANGDYQAGCARLAELRGTNGVALTSVNDFLSQYKKVAAQRKGTVTDRVSIPSELESQFRSAWNGLSAEDRTSFSKALHRMTDLAGLKAEDARGKAMLAARAARQKTQQAQDAYRAACSAYIAGSGTEADMLAAAKAAYKDSAWVGKAEQELLSGVLDNAAFSAGVILNNSEANARMNGLQSYAQAVLVAYSGALGSRGTELQQEWDQSLQDLSDRKSTWYAQAGLVMAKASSAWDSSQQKLARAFGEWQQAFQQEYSDKSDSWNVAYMGFAESKDQWVQATGKKAAQVGNEAILSEVGASADDSSRNASTLLVGAMSYNTKEAAEKVEALLGQVGSGQSLAVLKRMGSGIPQESAAVASGVLGADTSGMRTAAEVKRFIATSRKELSVLAARGLADDARASVEEAKKALSQSVKEANKGFEKSMDEVFVTVGYGKSGGEYKREAVARSTFFGGTKMETQSVGGYRWYALPALELKVDLNQGRLSGLEAGAVIDLVGMAQEEVGEAQKKVFGEGKVLSEAEKRAKGLLVDFTANDTTGTKELGEGEFGQWVGYSPEFTKEPNFDKSQDDNVVVQGKGELGRLMGVFIWNQTKEARGWSEVQKPAWDKALWDDTGSWFKAPSLRTVGSIAAGVVATLTTGGIGGIAGIAATAAISTSSTLLFDTLDVVSGYKTWEEAGLDIGKSFFAGAATSTVGGLFNGFDPTKVGGISGSLGEFGKGAIGKGLLAGAQSFTTNLTTSAINAFNWTDGHPGWSTDAFVSGGFSMNAMASVAGASGSAFTGGLMGMVNMVDGNETALSGNVFNTRGISSFNNLTGGLVSTGIQYGMTGETTLNLMNISDFGSERGYGLLEMHLGGEQGFGMNLGSNGTNMSYATLASSAGGISESYKIAKAKYENMQGDKTALTTLNSANGLGYTDDNYNYQLAKDIWNGNKNVVYYNASMPAVTTQDLAALGYAGDDGKSIYINSKLLGGGKEGDAQVASILSHEGKHLAGKDEFESRMTETGSYSDLMTAWGVTGAGYEDTGLAWGANMLRTLGAGGYGFVLDAQIASLPMSSSGRMYDQAAVQDLGVLAQTQLQRAVASTNTESNKLWDYLVQSGDEGKIADILCNNSTFSNFSAGVLSEGAYSDAFALLGGLREALKDSKDFAAGSVLSHDMLQYTTNVFRGSNGMNGLSGALFLANLASEDVVRAGNASGYLINDVARTYEGEYLSINYNRTGVIAGDLTGAQYYMNFHLKGPGYGQSITGYFNGGWVNSPIITTSLDCVGYVNTVLYASGALKAGQALNASVKGNKVEVGIWSKEYTSAYEKQLSSESGIVANGLSNAFLYAGWPQMKTDRELADQYAGGAWLAYGDDRKVWTNTPQVGDLVFMQGHMGFYGINDDGQNILVHSAPQWPQNEPQFEAGPRENYLGNWMKTSTKNDDYTNMLVENGYFKLWRDQFNPGYNFGRLKSWWTTTDFYRK
jgi:hypothetical protein